MQEIFQVCCMEIGFTQKITHFHSLIIFKINQTNYLNSIFMKNQTEEVSMSKVEEVLLYLAVSLPTMVLAVTIVHSLFY